MQMLQVLSNSVAKAIRMLLGEEARETVRFVEIFNKFFDCLNVSCLEEGQHKRCPNKSPYRSGSDARLTVYYNIRVKSCYIYSR